MVFKSFVNSDSGCILKIDPALFIWYNENGNLQGFVPVYVDDFLFAESDKFHKSIITKLKATFLIGKGEKLNFKYLGLNVTPNSNNITLNQF